MTATENNTVLDVRGLRTEFSGDAGTVTVVDDVSWSLRRGRTLALVGESGCGKTVTALSIMRLLPGRHASIRSGQVLFRPDPHAPPMDLATAREADLGRLRGNRIAMIFQDPMTALNPVFPVGRQVAEVACRHRGLARREAGSLAVRLLDRVGLGDPERRARDYPYRLSGGMRQRVMIAMALAGNPVVLIADEPTTALDVTIQDQILTLLRSVQDETGMSILLITHDLAVVAQAADDACVMYAGRVVEQAPVGDLFARPMHPYTQGLINCIPDPGRDRSRLASIPGAVADVACPPPGCRFHPRCALAVLQARQPDRVAEEVADGSTPRVVLRRCIRDSETEPGGVPPLREVGPGHAAACWEV